nr:hypothetical protein [Tanacetum cinerariifolium]
MARQCLKPKRKRDATWFRDKILLVEAQGKGKVLNEEELEFLADPSIAEAKAVLMANFSNYGSDVLSKCLFETQNAAVQDTNSSAQQDAIILSVFEQLSNQVTNCNKVNEENLIANETLSAELKRYKEQKAQQIRPMLYDGSVIAKDTNVISIVDSEETLMLEKESRSNMLLKQSDPIVLENKVNIKQINYAELNRLSKDFGKHFFHNKNSLMNKLFGYKLHTLIMTNLLLRLLKLRLLGNFLRDKNNRETHIYHFKHTMEQAAILKEIVEQARSLNPLDSTSYSACNMNVHAKSTSKKNKKRKEWKPIGKVFNSVGYKWKPTGRTFTLVRNVCPLTRITSTNKVPLRVPIPLKVVAPKHVITRVYTRIPKVPKSVQNIKPKVAKSMNDNIMEPGTSWGADTLVAPSSSSLIDCSQVSYKVKTILGYKAASPAEESFVKSSEMLENQENVKSRSDKGYHAVPPPYTGNYIPPKPDLTFIDEQVESKYVDVVSNVTSSAVKTVESRVESVDVKNKGVYNTVETKPIKKNNFSPPIIED